MCFVDICIHTDMREYHLTEMYVCMCVCVCTCFVRLRSMRRRVLRVFSYLHACAYAQLQSHPLPEIPNRFDRISILTNSDGTEMTNRLQRAEFIRSRLLCTISSSYDIWILQYIVLTSDTVRFNISEMAKVLYH